jgi:hypothetical protein
MIRILFLALLFFGIQHVFAQEIKMSWNAEKTNSNPQCFEKFLKGDNESFTVLNQIIINEDAYGMANRLNPVIKKYSTDFELIKEFDFNKIFKSKCTIINLNGNLYCFSEQRDYEHKQNQLVVQQINETDYTLNTNKKLVTSIPYTSLSFPGEHFIITSADNSKLAIVDAYPYKTKPFTFQISVFEPGFQLKYQTLIEVDGDMNCAIQKVLVSENSEVYTLLKQGKSAYRFYKTEPKKGKVRQLTLDNSMEGLDNLNLIMTHKTAWLSATANTVDNSEPHFLLQALTFKRRNGNVKGLLYSGNQNESLKMATKICDNKIGQFYSAFEMEQGLVVVHAESAADSSQNLIIQLFNKNSGHLQERFDIETIDLGLDFYPSRFVPLDAWRVLMYARRQNVERYGILRIQ